MYNPDSTLSGFDGTRRIARGTPLETALQAAAYLAGHPAARLLFFNMDTGRQVELDLRGSPAEIRQRMAALSPASGDSGDAPAQRSKGRPRLGVVAREVTLLPRHWEWLSRQRGGASAALRRLVDEARRVHAQADRRRLAQERAYRFMSAIAANWPWFEEASRALFAGDGQALARRTAGWPADVRDHLAWLARDAWADEA